jgi:Fe-S cluster assembly protein SufB
MSTSTETIEQFVNREYQYGFVTDVESDEAPRGLSEDTVPVSYTHLTLPTKLL